MPRATAPKMANRSRGGPSANNWDRWRRDIWASKSGRLGPMNTWYESLCDRPGRQVDRLARHPAGDVGEGEVVVRLASGRRRSPRSYRTTLVERLDLRDQHGREVLAVDAGVGQRLAVAHRLDFALGNVRVSRSAISGLPANRTTTSRSPPPPQRWLILWAYHQPSSGMPVGPSRR